MKQTLIINTLPDLSRSFQRMKLADEIQLRRNNGFWAECMAKAAKDMRNLDEIVREIQEQYSDNPALVTQMMGEKVITLIKQLYA